MSADTIPFTLEPAPQDALDAGVAISLCGTSGRLRRERKVLAAAAYLPKRGGGTLWPF